MGILHSAVEPSPTVEHFSVVLLGVIQCAHEGVEAAAPGRYGSSEGEDRLQYAGFGSKVPVAALDGLCAGCIRLLLNGLMLGQIVPALVQASEFPVDRCFETAFTVNQFRDSPAPILGLRPLPDECVDALFGSVEGSTCLCPGGVGSLAVAPLRQPGLLETPLSTGFLVVGSFSSNQNAEWKADRFLFLPSRAAMRPQAVGGVAPPAVSLAATSWRTLVPISPK